MYSPVASLVALRILIHASARFDFKLFQLDVSGAFLYGKLNSPVYLELPTGHCQRRGRHLVWKSYTALYGLVQAPAVWNQTMHSFLTNFGFKNLCTESCIYVLRGVTGNLDVMVILYVDDVLFTGVTLRVENFKSAISKKFKVKMSDDPKEFIGVEVKRQSNEVLLAQPKHILKAVEAYGLKGAKPYSTPLDPTSMNVEDSPTLEDPKLFQKLLGSLNYIAQASRPDLAFAVGFLARHGKNPTMAAYRKAKRSLVYLRDTINLALVYRKQKVEKNELIMYVDSSFANGTGKRSIYGFIVLLNSSVILYKSKQQPIVTLSSTEAEFVGLALSIKEVKWIKSILEELNLKPDLCVIYSDNQGCIKIATNKSSTERSKHVDIKLQYSKQHILSGEMELRYVRTTDNVADIFTKPLRRLDFQKFTKWIFGNWKEDE